MSIELLFDKYKCEFGKFENINFTEKLHENPLICALLYLNSIYSDQIYYQHEDEGLYIHGLNFSIDELVEKDILYLIRCGIKYDRENDNLVFKQGDNIVFK